MPVEPMESMLRPFNLVIPFTVQKGELTGTVLGPGGTTAQGVDTFVQIQTLVLRDENWGPGRGEGGVSSQGHLASWAEMKLKLKASASQFRVHPSAPGWCLTPRVEAQPHRNRDSRGLWSETLRSPT